MLQQNGGEVFVRNSGRKKEINVSGMYRSRNTDNERRDVLNCHNENTEERPLNERNVKVTKGSTMFYGISRVAKYLRGN